MSASTLPGERCYQVDSGGGVALHIPLSRRFIESRLGPPDGGWSPPEPLADGDEGCDCVDGADLGSLLDVGLWTSDHDFEGDAAWLGRHVNGICITPSDDATPPEIRHVQRCADLLTQEVPVAREAERRMGLRA